MKLAVILLAVMAMASAKFIGPVGDVKHFDKDMLYTQKFVLDVLFKVWAPFYNQEYTGMGDKLYVDKTFYTQYDKDMEYFEELYKTFSLTPRGKYINSFNKFFLKESTGLFKFFYNAKNFETFQKNVVWARQNVNEFVFVYALEMFFIHSEHYQYIVLPAIYEILPFAFYNGKFINTVMDFDYDTYKYEQTLAKKWFEEYKKIDYPYNQYVKKFDWYTNKFQFIEDKTILRDDTQMSDFQKYKDFFEGTKMFWTKADYSAKYDYMNEHYKLIHLTESFDWNMFWYYFNLYYPTNLHSKELKMTEERRGEYFIFILQQLMGRYHLERYSYGLTEVKSFNFDRKYEYGYNPQLSIYGQSYSYRPNYYEYKSHENSYSILELSKTMKERMHNIIDLGYYEMADGTKIYLNKPENVEQLGLILQGNVDVVDRKFLENWFSIFVQFAALQDDEAFLGNQYYDYMPNVLLNYETMLRDPMAYSLFKDVLDVYYQYKYRLGSYKKEDLLFPGVKITDVTTDKLVTFYDLIDYDASVLLDKNFFYKDGKFSWDYAVFGRRLRLNNKPFKITYKFDSDKDQKVVFRTFLGPKYDEYGRELVFDYSRKYFMELDNFYVNAVNGPNEYARSSEDIYYTRDDHTTYFELYKSILYATEGKFEFPIDHSINKFCGFTRSLIFPRGWTEGLPMKLYVIATPYDALKDYTYEENQAYCGYDYDKLAYGYPLDRPIDELYFWTPNMYFKDVLIYHLKDLHVPEQYKMYYSDKYYF